MIDTEHVPDLEDNDGLIDLIEEKLGSNLKNSSYVKNIIINDIKHIYNKH